MMQRLAAQRQTLMQLLVGTRACIVAQPIQRFSVVNVETVTILYLFIPIYREISQSRRRRERRVQERSLTLKSQDLKMQLPTALHRLPPLSTSHSISHSLLVMLRRFSQPPTISLPPRKIPFQADMPPFFSQPPLRKIPSMMSTKT